MPPTLVTQHWPIWILMTIGWDIVEFKDCNNKIFQDSWILWIHVFTAFLMFPCSIFLMRRFSIGLKMRDTSLKITRTIVIENIPPLVCTPELIKEHFQQIEAYRDFKINDIQVHIWYINWWQNRHIPSYHFSILFFNCSWYMMSASWQPCLTNWRTWSTRESFLKHTR